MTLCLTSLIGMEMPFINFITKVDLLSTMGKPDMGLNFYQGTTSGLKYMFFGEYEQAKELEQTDTKVTFNDRFARLTKSLCDLFETYQ